MSVIDYAAPGPLTNLDGTVETLPWDEWGRMDEAYQGKTGADYDELLDELATVCATDDSIAICALYHRDGLTVPADLIR